MRWRATALAVLGAVASITAGSRTDAAAETAGRIERIALANDGSSTKVVIGLSRPLAYEVHVLPGDATRKSARRLVLDFADATLAPAAVKPIEVSGDRLRQIRPGQFDARTARIVLDLADDSTHAIGASDAPPEVTITLDGPAATEPRPVAAGPSDVATPVVASTPRRIPIRARGRRPYSLIYSR